MTITTVGIICDVGMPDNAEFTAARLTFYLSGPDYDTASNDAIPGMSVIVDLSATGTGTANLWPVNASIRTDNNDLWPGEGLWGEIIGNRAAPT